MSLDVDALMAKSEDGVLVLRPGRLKMFLLLLLSAGFVFAGVVMLSHEKGSVLIGWLTILFFGLGVIVFVVQLLPGSAYLRLDGEGDLTTTFLYL